MAAPAKRSPIPLEEFETSTVDPAAAVGLPPAAYTDPDFFAFEVDAAFGNQWMCIGRIDQIPNSGDFFTITLAGGEQVIVDRTADGRINVMSTVCQHRGMCVTAPADRPKGEWLELPPEVSGNTRTFRCPYHWWIYDLEGKLLGAPEMHERTSFNRANFGLPTLGVEVWNGFIFANFDQNAAPLAPRMQKLTKILENYHLEDMVSTTPETLVDVPYNWKIMVENFMEGYHNNRLHNSLYDIERGDAPAEETMLSGIFTEYEPGDGAIAGAGVTAHRDRGLNPTQRALFPPIDTLTDEERWHMVYAYVPPSLLLGVSTDSAFWFLVTPRTADAFTLQMSFVFPRSTMELRLFTQLFTQHVGGVELFNGQDLPANIAVQKGMHSRYAPRGPLSRQDNFLVQFNQWLVERYREAEARDVGMMALADAGATRLMPANHWDWTIRTPFSQGWKVGNFVFVGGQVPVGLDHRVIGTGDIATQTRVVFDNIGKVLAEAGASMSDVVKLNTYYKFDGSGPEETEFWKALTTVRLEYLADPGPAATAVRVVGFARQDTLIEVEAIAVVPDEEGRMLERVRIMPEGHWDWAMPTPFSQGWKVGNLVFVGGQISAQGKGEVIGVDDIELQTRNTFENIRAVLREANADLSDIVKLNTYYKFEGVGPEENDFWKRMTRVRLEYLGDPGPAATAIRVVGFAFEHILIEIEAIAVVPA